MPRIVIVSEPLPGDAPYIVAPHVVLVSDRLVSPQEQDELRRIVGGAEDISPAECRALTEELDLLFGQA